MHRRQILGDKPEDNEGERRPTRWGDRTVLPQLSLIVVFGRDLAEPSAGRPVFA
jgi:hypothetical protein